MGLGGGGGSGYIGDDYDVVGGNLCGLGLLCGMGGGSLMGALIAMDAMVMDV